MTSTEAPINLNNEEVDEYIRIIKKMEGVVTVVVPIIFSLVIIVGVMGNSLV